MNDAEAAHGPDRAALPAADDRRQRLRQGSLRLLRRQGDLRQGQGRPRDASWPGRWKEDIEVARAAVQLAQSQVESIKINLERLIVRAPMDGEVLQLNVRLGQFAAMAWKEPMIVLGDIKRLHVRVDIDENDLPYFSKSAPRPIATLKGRPQVRFPLEVRLRRALRHPQAEPDRLQLRAGRSPASSRSSTSCPTSAPVDVYVGQQMDVYLKAVPASQAGATRLRRRRSRQLPFEEEARSEAPAKPAA